MRKKSTPPERIEPADPQVDPQFGIELLQRLIARAEALLAQGHVESPDIHAWNELAKPQMLRALGGRASESIDAVLYASGGIGFWMDQTPGERQQEYRGQLTNKIRLLRGCISNVETEIEVRARASSQVPTSSAERSAMQVLERLADRFHTVARQLRHRQRQRAPFTIDDEYDVQDLLHALLRVEFDDVRPEENTPSYAGSGSRMDFLLKNEEIVVEAKCTREGLDAAGVGKQLLVDIAKYREHPNCKRLFCFVYDPEGRINNPRGLESDLSGDREGLAVRVRIRPQT